MWLVMKIKVCMHNYIHVLTVIIIISITMHAIPDRIHRISEFEYTLQPTSRGVCITCTFLDSSTTDCVAVVHQRISQLSSSGLMNIESSHKFNRSGDTAYGCIEGVHMKHYQVGVVGGVRRKTTTETFGKSCSDYTYNHKKQFKCLILSHQL